MSEQIPTHNELTTLDRIHDTGYRCWAAGEAGFYDALNEGVTRGVAKAMEHYMILTTEETEALKSLARREAREAERWEAIKRQVLGWGIIAIAGWIGKLVLDAITHYKSAP